MKITNSVILSEAKNLIQSIGYEILLSVQGDTFSAFARASYILNNVLYDSPFSLFLKTNIALPCSRLSGILSGRHQYGYPKTKLPHHSNVQKGSNE